MATQPDTAQHTKGPWWIDQTDRDAFEICGAPDKFGADIVVSGYFDNPADAKLIASAPELLEALEWAVNEFDGNTRYDNAEQLANCIDKCRAAIAKARGQ